MSLSLLFDARLMLDKPTGIGQYIASLVPELLRLAPDLRLHLLRRPAPWPGYGVEQWQAPTLTHHVSRAPHMTLRQHWTLPRLARRLGVDLVHYPHFDAPVLVGQVPVVATLHDAKYLVRPDFFTRLSAPKRRYMRWSFAQTLRRAAAVIADSQATATDLQRLFPVKAPLHVIPLAADPRFRPASPSAITAFRQRYRLDRPFILSVGELRPHKNHVGLIEAFARSQSRATHNLVLIGQPHAGYDALQRRAQALGVAAQLHVLTDVAPPSLIAAYSAADLFVLVSLYEGFGLPVLEAMACGTPVVASCTTALGEVAGEGALLVEPTDTAAISLALDRLLLNRAAHQRQRERGQHWLARWSWEATARRTLAVYEAARRNAKAKNGQGA